MVDNSTRISREERRQRIKDTYSQLSADDLIFIPARKQTEVEAEAPKKRVCAYCRVSTDDPAQTTSYELQKEHYEEYISRNPDWIFAGIYADEGISATSMKHRDNFNRMIADAKAGKIDIIITKAVSRFARNVVDCLSMVRKLAALNPPVAVHFETEGINTLETASEMILTVMAAAAQEESKTKSNAMNWSLENRFKKGKFLTPVLLGYDHDEDGRLTINPEEADTVKLIYCLYLSGFPISEIADILSQFKRSTKLGNTSWSMSSIRGILRNERNCGNVLSWKTYTYDFWEHKKRKNNHNKPQVLKVDHHEGIISHEIFEAAQIKLESEKYSRQGLPMPTLSVIDEGVLRGYVSVNRLWRGFSDVDYTEASSSVYDSNPLVSDRAEEGFNPEGYQIVKSSMFSTSDRPSMTIAKGQVKFNSVCMKKFESVEYVELLLNSVEKCIAVRPCDKTNPNAIRWGYLKDSKWIVTPKSCRGLVSPLCALMNWEVTDVHKIVGRYYSDGDDKILLFDLSEASIKKYKVETDEVKGEILVEDHEAEATDNWGRAINVATKQCIIMFEEKPYKGNWNVMCPTRVFRISGNMTSNSMLEVEKTARDLLESFQAQLA